ncbi:MAG: hypothetical protein Fur0034_05290 [Desulfuromonadia bacterium]
MKRFLPIISLLTLLVIPPSAARGGGEILRFPEETPGGTNPILAPQGTDIRFVLSGNRQHGFRWYGVSSVPMVAAPVDAGSRYIPEGIDGSGGGKFHLLFRTAMPGKTTITLQYGKEGSPPQKSYAIDVTVPAVPNPEELFQQMDSSGDGSVSREEFLASPQIPLRVDLSGTFSIPLRAADANGDGTVTLRELKESLFRRMDRNGSGGISREEFQQFLGGAFILFSP